MFMSWLNLPKNADWRNWCIHGNLLRLIAYNANLTGESAYGRMSTLIELFETKPSCWKKPNI